MEIFPLRNITFTMHIHCSIVGLAPFLLLLAEVDQGFVYGVLPSDSPQIFSSISKSSKLKPEKKKGLFIICTVHFVFLFFYKHHNFYVMTGCEC